VSRRHVVLVGLPGSGKSTVGREAARLLGAEFTDLDAWLIEQIGMPIADLFALRGEPEFRRLESRGMDNALAGAPQVIAPGGGWVAQAGNLERAGDVLLVYLAVDPAVAARRLEGDTSRPLLAVGELLEQIQVLLREREPWYRRAAVEVDAGRQVSVVAGEVATHARRLAGWDET
jgi:shikimate kinase